MADIERVEAYAVLLLLSAAVIIFGMFQMEGTLSAAARNADFSTFEIMIRGIQVAALALIVSTFMILFYLKELKEGKFVFKKPVEKPEEKPVKKSARKKPAKKKARSKKKKKRSKAKKK